MAAARETPRQKMINMMYLVLTAMLALQVSNSILQKFLTIDKSLMASNSQANQTNSRIIESMKVAVEKAGNRPEYIQLLNTADQVRKKTQDVNTYIEGLRRQIETAGGGINPETGEIRNLSEEEKVANLFVGHGNKKDGLGYELQRKLKAYSEELNKITGGKVQLADLAPNAKNDPAFATTRDRGELNKDFSEVMFASTPVPAALASLSQKMSEIRRQEAEVLNYLAQQVGAKEIKFDKIFAVVIPDARTVVAGQTYKAEVAIGAYSSSITPRISINGSPIAVVDGKGKYEVRAQGGQYDQNGTLKRSYTASISYPKPDGTLQQVTQDESYTVLKPSVQLESATLPHCISNVPTAFKPALQASGLCLSQALAAAVGSLFRVQAER